MFKNTHTQIYGFQKHHKWNFHRENYHTFTKVRTKTQWPNRPDKTWQQVWSNLRVIISITGEFHFCFPKKCRSTYPNSLPYTYNNTRHQKIAYRSEKPFFKDIKFTSLPAWVCTIFSTEKIHTIIVLCTFELVINAKTPKHRAVLFFKFHNILL